MPKTIEPSPHLATLSVRVPITWIARVYTTAAEKHLDPSVVVRRAVERFIEEYEQETGKY